MTIETTKAARLLNTVAPAVILAAFLVQALLALPRLSATNDEPVHIAAGYSYWKTLDFRLNPEHPPLAKLVAALPLLFLRPTITTTGDDWKNADQFRIGFDFLYH